MHVVIFEGSQWDAFAPLSLSKPTFMLPCGMGTLLDKQLRLLAPTRLTLWVRPQFADYCRQYVLPGLKVPAAINAPLDDEPALVTTGRTLHFARFEPPDEPAVVLEEGDIVRMAYVRGMTGLGPEDVMTRSKRWLELMELPQTLPQARFADHVWDLIAWNEEALIADFVHHRGDGESRKDGPWHLINPDDIEFMPGAKLSAGCVLDASHGPIVVDKGASIGANAVLEGPCYIGPYSQVSPLTNIRAGTTVGAICKVGGEISNSIISPFSNLPHHGYVGNSFIGSWVNLGAGTTTSDLKNTYGEVSIRIGAREFETGRRRLGAFVGDHSKLAIGTRLNTGSYIGYCCQVSGSVLTPKFMPSFTFWTDQGSQRYDLEKAIAVAKRVLDRRDKRWTPADEQIMRYVAQTAPAIEK